VADDCPASVQVIRDRRSRDGSEERERMGSFIGGKNDDPLAILACPRGPTEAVLMRSQGRREMKVGRSVGRSVRRAREGRGDEGSDDAPHTALRLLQVRLEGRA
jgi:hypothetical protein